jgi:type VI secretion system protein
MRLPQLIGTGLSLVLSAGCSGQGEMPQSSALPTTQLVSIRVLAEPEANQRGVTALDIVLAYDQAATEKLPASGPAWFESKAGLLKTYPETLDVVSIQLPPGTLIPDLSLPERYKTAVRVIAYPNYLAKTGQSRADLTLFKRAVITLKPETVEYVDE